MFRRGLLLILLVLAVQSCAPPGAQDEAGAGDGPPAALQLRPEVDEIPAGRPFAVEVIALFPDGEREIGAQAEWIFEQGEAEVLADTNEAGQQLLRATAPGKLVLRAAYQGVIGEAVELQVTEEVLEAIELRVIGDTRLRWPQGSEVRLQAVGRFSLRGSLDISDRVQWSSADESVAQFSQPGRLLAVAPGVTRVFARWDQGLVGEREVSIDPPQLIELILAREGSGPVTLGEAVALTVEGRYSDGRTEQLADYQWLQQGQGEFEISNGRLIARRAGTVSLIVSHAGLRSAPLMLEIEGPRLQSLAIKLAATLLPAGVSLPIQLEALMSDGQPYEGNAAVQWQISDESVLAVTGDSVTGLRLEALAPGTAEIVVRLGDGGIEARELVTVVEAGRSTLQLLNRGEGLQASEQRRLPAVMVSPGGEVNTAPIVHCESSDPGIIAVLESPGGCDVLALAVGAAQVRAVSSLDPDNSYSLDVRVEPLPELGLWTPGDEFRLDTTALPPDPRYGRRLQGSFGGFEPGGEYLVHVAPAAGGELDASTRLWTAPGPSLSRADGACQAWAAVARARLTCQVRVAEAGRIYVGIEDSGGATPVRLWVSQGSYANQGRPDAPWPVLLDQIVEGEVSANAINYESFSDYRISGLDFADDEGNQWRYRVSLLQPTETVLLQVSRPGGVELCTAPADVLRHVPGQAIECLVDAGRVGELRIRVYGFMPQGVVLGASADGGARYRLRVTQEPL